LKGVIGKVLAMVITLILALVALLFLWTFIWKVVPHLSELVAIAAERIRDWLGL
jgi:hypothetical protein